MPMYRVFGVELTSGRETSFPIEAATPQEAEAGANRRGFAVDSGRTRLESGAAPRAGGRRMGLLSLVARSLAAGFRDVPAQRPRGRVRRGQMWWVSTIAFGVCIGMWLSAIVPTVGAILLAEIGHAFSDPKPLRRSSGSGGANAVPIEETDEGKEQRMVGMGVYGTKPAKWCEGVTVRDRIELRNADVPCMLAPNIELIGPIPDFLEDAGGEFYRWTLLIRNETGLPFCAGARPIFIGRADGKEILEQDAVMVECGKGPLKVACGAIVDVRIARQDFYSRVAEVRLALYPR